MTFILWGKRAGNEVDLSASFNLVSDFHLTWSGVGDGDLGVNPGAIVFLAETIFLARLDAPADGKITFIEPAVFKIETSGPGLSEPVQAEFREPTLFEVGQPDVWGDGEFSPRDPLADVVGSERDEISEVVVP